MGVSGLFILGLAIANRALATDDALVNQGRWSRLEPLPWSSTSCLLRVTLSCGKEEQAESRYGDLLSFPQQDGFVQVTVGKHPKLRKITNDPSREGWKEVVEFDCVEPWSTMVFTLYSGSMRPLASCETQWATDGKGSMEGICHGYWGVDFRYQVEHEMKLETGIATHGTPALRALQFESDTPTPSPSPIDPSTPGPQSFSDSVTLTTQPVLPPTNAPVAVMTPQPVTPTPAPRTVAPMVAATPAPTIAPALLPPTNTPVMIVPPTMTPTAPPVKAPTASPVIAPTASPVTPQTLPPTVENTPSPSKAPTPEPSLALVSPTGSPVTLAPVPSTEAPALTAVPTPEPTFSPSGMQTNPVAPPSTAPVPQPTTSPLASLSPQTPTILPTLAPNVIPTNLPSIAPDDTTRPSSAAQPSSSPAAETPTASVMPSVVLTTPGTTVPPLSTSKLPTPAPGGTGTPSPTASPDEATPAPAPEAPPTPRPVVLVVPTPSPVSSIGQCDSDCGNIILESSDYGAYYDEGCENSDANGCNLDASGDQFDNCRRCVIDPETYDGDANYWECPCCVSESCPSTSSAGEDLDFRDLETDPWMLVMEFSQTTCEATGILVEDNDESILDITKFVGAGGECGSDYESNTFYGELCEADGLNYSASIGSSSYTYQWDDICAESDLGRRRLLEFGSASYESMEILCNDDSKFVALFDITDGDYGMIYAQSSAQGYDALVAGQGEPSEEMCDDDANAVMERLMTSNLEDLIGTGDTSSSDDNGNDFDWIIIISVVAGMVILLGCVCCILCRRRGKVDRADQMRRNLGYTPDMEAKGEGNFGPTSTHVAITRGGGPKPTAEMLATKAYQGSYPVHNRAPSEAPSSIIENNISNNYRPRQAQQVWEERRVRKELTKPPTHQNVVTGATRGSASEELKTENVTQSARSSDAPRSEQLSEASLSKLEQERSSSQVLQAEGQPPFQYAYDGEVVPEEDDDDARSAMTGMSGPSKYAPSGYAPSSHHGVTHDQLSHYEPSVYEADSTYDASIYGRESEFDDGSTYHSHDARSSHRGSGYAVRGRGGYHATSTRGSVADTAAGSVLGSVLEMDDGDDAGRSAYAPSESYVSSYISSEDEGRVGRALSRNVQANGDNEPSPASGRTSRHSAHRSGRESVNGGRGFTPSTTRTMSSRHHSGRSGFDHESRGFDDDTYEGGHGSMEDVQYFDDDRHSQVPSSQGVPLTNADETSSSRPDW